MQNVLKRFGVKATDSSNGSFEKHYSRSIMQLTLLYVGILVLILSVSGVISYSTFSSRISRRFEHVHQDIIVSTPTQSEIIVLQNPDILPPHPPTAQEVRDDFIRSLILVNTCLLLLAATLSYLLARVTLRPIKKAYDAQQQFLANASHELRTPLSILQLELENELSSKSLGETTKERITSNLEEVDRMSRIVGDLLMLSRLDEGKSDMLAPSVVHIDALLSRIVSNLDTLASANSVTLTVEKNPSEIVVHSHEDVLFHAISNVVKNAIVYNKPEGSVVLSYLDNDKTISIIVRDTGIGIDSEHLPKIFNRFYRVDEHRARSSGGSGLGLSIVRTSLEQLGGTVVIESKKDKGTTVTITLPKN